MSKNSKSSLHTLVELPPFWLKASEQLNESLYHDIDSMLGLSHERQLSQKKIHDSVREKMQGYLNQEDEGVNKINALENALSESNARLRAELYSMNDALETARAERRVQEASSHNLKQKLSSLMAHVPIGVVELSASGIVVDANTLACELLELPLVGMAWSEVIRKSFKPRPDDGFEVSLVNGKRVQVQTQSLDSLDGQIILLNDQTQTRQLQQAVARNERMAALGKTAATLAHQVRTPLCGALLYLSEVLADPQMPHQFFERLMRAKGRLEHLERQVQQILMLSRGQLSLAQICSPKEIVCALSAACAPIREGFSSLSLEDKTQDECWYAKCNCEALIGAVVNVIENAIQACHDAGSVSISVYIEKTGLTNLLHQINQAYLTIEVKDTGIGIEKERVSKILEPFYTGRPDGTGLGMSVVKMVVDAHDGKLDIQSKKGCGTLVRIKIPLIHRVG